MPTENLDLTRIIDVSKNGTTKIELQIIDKAGNKSETDIFVFRQGEISQPERVSPDFIIKRPRYTAHTAKHIVFPANIDKIELEKWPSASSVPAGTTRWYCDGELVSSDRIWNSNLPSVESGSHSILAVVDNGMNLYYSQPRIKNKEIIEEKQLQDLMRYVIGNKLPFMMGKIGGTELFILQTIEFYKVVVIVHGILII